jgi:hypothetical protein
MTSDVNRDISKELFPLGNEAIYDSLQNLRRPREFSSLSDLEFKLFHKDPDIRLRAASSRDLFHTINPSQDQIDRLLQDSDYRVVATILRRLPYSPTESQSNLGLFSSNQKITGAFIDYLACFSEEQIERLCNLDYSNPDAAENLNAFLSNPNWILSANRGLALLKTSPPHLHPLIFHRCELSSEILVQCFEHSDNASQISMLKRSDFNRKHTLALINHEHISDGITHPVIEIRCLWISSNLYSPSSSAYKFFLNSPDPSIRVAAASRHDFEPTFTQLKQGLRDPFLSVRTAFLKKAPSTWCVASILLKKLFMDLITGLKAR